MAPVSSITFNFASLQLSFISFNSSLIASKSSSREITQVHYDIDFIGSIARWGFGNLYFCEGLWWKPPETATIFTFAAVSPCLTVDTNRIYADGCDVRNLGLVPHKIIHFVHHLQDAFSRIEARQRSQIDESMYFFQYFVVEIILEFCLDDTSWTSLLPYRPFQPDRIDWMPGGICQAVDDRNPCLEFPPVQRSCSWSCPQF